MLSTLQTSLKNMNESEFKNEVFAAPLAGNVDEPEGGLDALMQVTNWKKQKYTSSDRKKMVY